MSAPYWRLSAFYFYYFAIIGAFLPFWSLYLKQVGFEANRIGELTALLVATKIVSPYLWGWLADRSGKRLRIVRLTSLLAAVMFAGFLPGGDYYWFAAVTAAFSFFWNASMPQFEAATLYHIRAESHRYSRIRLWGSVGFIAAVLGIGRFLDSFDIAYLPYIILGLMILTWLAALAVPEAKSQKPSPDGQGIWQVVGNREVLAFFMVYLLLQISHGPYYVFYSVYLKQYGYSASITGLLWALGVCSEIVMFMAVGPLLRAFSPRGLLLASLAASLVRWLAIARFAEFPAVLAAAQLLHAASFGIAHLVAIQLLSRYFGARHQGKGQALYASLSFGLGGMLGSLYSGYFWDSQGGGFVFDIAGFASGLAFLIAFAWVGGKTPAPAIPSLSK